MYLNEQAANTDDNQTELEQLRICQHGHPSFLEGKEAPSWMGEAYRLPLLAALKDHSFLSTEYHSVRQNATVSWKCAQLGHKIKPPPGRDLTKSYQAAILSIERALPVDG